MAYKAIGIFNDLTITELTEIRDEAVATLRNGGKTLMSWNAAGQQFTKQFAMPVKEILIEANYSLRIKQGKLIRKTYAQFIN